MKALFLTREYPRTSEQMGSMAMAPGASRMANRPSRAAGTAGGSRARPRVRARGRGTGAGDEGWRAAGAAATSRMPPTAAAATGASPAMASSSAAERRLAGPVAEASRQDLPQGHPRAVQPRLDRGDRLPEDLGDLLVRQLLHIPQHQKRAVVLRQPIQGLLENLSRLPRDQLVLRGLGPICEEPRPVAFAMAVGEEGRQAVLQADLELDPLAPPLDQRGVGGDAIEPGPDGRAPLEHVDLPEQRQEGVLHDLFRFRVAARDPEGHTVDARAVALHQYLERQVILGAQTLDQRQIRDGIVGPALSRFRNRRHHVVSCRALSCSATKREQFTRVTRSSRSLHSRSTPSRLTNETPERSSVSLAPVATIGSHTHPRSSTHGSMTCPSRCNVVPWLGAFPGMILSIPCVLLG